MLDELVIMERCLSRKKFLIQVKSKYSLKVNCKSTRDKLNNQLTLLETSCCTRNIYLHLYKC